MAAVRIGTSGWSYKDWGKHFYPPDVTGTKQLPYLARHFPTVELNASFYHLPGEKTFQGWFDKTPVDFSFAIKIPRFITHTKRLEEVGETWERIVTNSRPLGPKLRVFLAQFPPSFKADQATMQRLEAFVKLVARQPVPLVIELRHNSWFEPTTMTVLSKLPVNIVFAESSRFPHTPLEYRPPGLAYYRFHGPERLYSSAYSDEQLKDWAEHIARQVEAGRAVYAYFDNDVNGYALNDARRLTDLVQSMDLPVARPAAQGR